MKLKSAFPRLFFAGVASVAGACSPPAAVEKPTWVDDVYPILQGQCLHCHGADFEANKANRRFDFLDIKVCEDLGTGIDSDPKKLEFYVTPDDETGGVLMPPAPARPLEDWQIETIKNWEKTKNPIGKRANNKSPTLTVETSVSKGKLTLSYVAADADGDPVLGEIKVGDNLSHRFSSTGSGRVTFDLAGESGKLKVTARLCDGWKLVSLDDSDGLKTVDAK